MAKTAKTATVEGKQVTIGDTVCFKSDIEQSGRITKITRTQWGTELTLESLDEDGFDGDYIGGDTITSLLASDCWIE